MNKLPQEIRDLKDNIPKEVNFAKFSNDLNSILSRKYTIQQAIKDKKENEFLETLLLAWQNSWEPSQKVRKIMTEVLPYTTSYLSKYHPGNIVVYRGMANKKYYKPDNTARSWTKSIKDASFYSEMDAGEILSLNAKPVILKKVITQKVPALECKKVRSNLGVENEIISIHDSECKRVGLKKESIYKVNLRKEIRKTLSEQLVVSDDIDVLGGIEDARDRINLILSILKPEPQMRRVLPKSNQKTVRVINSTIAAREEIEQLYENIKSVYDFVIEKW